MTTEYISIDVKNLSLDEWLLLIDNPQVNIFVADYEFPTDKHRDDYISTIHTRTDKEIREILLHFLIHSGSLVVNDNLSFNVIKDSILKYKSWHDSQFNQRLVSYKLGKSKIPPWEGITWILDLLPNSPKQALESLSAYISAHMFELPDGRINGLHEAQQIIRARYIGTPSSQIQKLQFLTSVTPREFEHIVERLYSAMGYNTHLTPPKKDGGRDIVAKKEKIGALEHLLIECKQYTKPVGVEIVRALLGVVSDEKVNKGVLVTTSTATKGTREFKGRNPRLELIEGKELIPLLNEYLGGDWPITIDGIIADSQRQNQPGKHAD